MRKNFIHEVRSVAHLAGLQRLYLSNNKVSSLENLSNMPVLSEITLENNPVELQTGVVMTLRARFPSLQYFNLQKVSTLLLSGKKDTASTLPQSASGAHGTPNQQQYCHKQRTLVSSSGQIPS